MIKEESIIEIVRFFGDPVYVNSDYCLARKKNQKDACVRCESELGCAKFVCLMDIALLGSNVYQTPDDFDEGKAKLNETALKVLSSKNIKELNKVFA